MKVNITVITYFIVCFWSIILRAEVVVTKDIDYTEKSNYADDRDLLDLYMPQGVKEAPVIVFFHGGALLYGDKTYAKGIAARLGESGLGLVAANYRLSPAHAHPSHVQDAAAATAWVINNIASYGGDPENVFVAGHSSGAYLAALVAVDSSLMEKHNIGQETLKGTILISPFLYVEETAPERITSNSVYKSIWGEKKEDWLKASVSGFIGPDRNDILVIYADGDDLWRKEQNERFVRDLKSEGNSNVSATEVRNRTHTTVMSAILEDDDQVGELMINFIRSLEKTDAKK
ncbi:MAG: acetyl esterase/lipase [Oceanicoccus sp.]|jgi:acetyl esterase/lipase